MVEINLLPPQYRKRSSPSAWRYATIAAPIVTAGVIIVASAVSGTQLGNINRQLEAVNGQISALEPSKREFDDLRRQQTALEQVTAVADTLRASKTYWSSDLARFVNALPSNQNIALTNLTMSPGTVSSGTPASANSAANAAAAGAVSKNFAVAGQARSTADLVTFLNSFEANSNFTVSLQSTQRSGTGLNAPYTFNATVGLLSSATPSTASGTPRAGSPTSTNTVTPASTGGN